ncbi:conserved Plasmodium protein, unknown function [Plasmodium chabaudi adami]|uniref:Fusion protein n=1 Tax=Plasmodium chabaudi adami TaxID=5826 RepID=A0A1D3LG74_PLACE|nr:conserved Plasmodium protein, unknown function [Plasmodium chabaudi adami]
MKIILTIAIFYICLCHHSFIENKKVAVSVFSYLVHNKKNIKRFPRKSRKQIYAKKNIIKYDEVVTQKDISNINTLVLALLEYKKIHNNLLVPEKYVLKSEDNENLKNFKLWEKLQNVKNETNDKKKKYIYLILKNIDFPLNTIFTEEEITKFGEDDAEVTTMSKLSTDENLHYDFDERREVWKELFSPYIKKEKDIKSENIKDFLSSYKFIPKISEQGTLPEYSNKSTRKKGILKHILQELKKNDIFCSKYNYYYDNIYNNTNDEEINEYFRHVMKFKKTYETYDTFVNANKQFLTENRKEKKYFLYTRKETEGAHSYDFDKWSFSDFVEALIFFNDLYLDLNKENYEKYKSDPENEKLDIIDFNKISSGFVVPNDSVWPSEWHDMPLGKYILQLRMGDIDGKFHFIRRAILDYLLFDFQSEEYKNKYIDFTWRKLYFGLAWFIHTRGHPIVITPFEKIQFQTFSMDFCKPEEIQGLYLGFLIVQAQSHGKMFWNNYRDRFDFMKGLEINIRSADELIF